MNESRTDRAGSIDGATRVVYFDGQRLQADDLNGAADQMRQLRWLHNRSLHGWGLALGFEATGQTGDRQATVQPGYAIDCLGRELVLTEAITLPVPARAGDAKGRPVTFALVAAHPDDDQLAVIQTRAADCGGGSGAVRLRESALVYWRTPPISTGREVLLAMATVQNCRLALPLAVDQTRRARPITTPYLAAGESPRGGTPWKPWMALEGRLLIGVRAEIDASVGRFTATPTYLAELRGERFFKTSPDHQRPPFLLDGALAVGDATPGSFTASILMPRQDTLNPPWLLQEDQDALIKLVIREWTVAWIGVEG